MNSLIHKTHLFYVLLFSKMDIILNQLTPLKIEIRDSKLKYFHKHPPLKDFHDMYQTIDLLLEIVDHTSDK